MDNLENLASREGVVQLQTKTFRIEFFASAAGAGDPSGHGEAERFIGTINVTTDAAGLASFTTPLDRS